MSALARQQQALLQALLDRSPQDAIKIVAATAMDTGARGLKAYQSHAHVLARRALASAYPVLAQLLGEESFADLARALWHAQPPRQGDVARWGAGLADFIAADAQLAPEPYLADVARCEWALHRAAFARDAAPQPQTLALLTTHDPTSLYLELAPGTACVPSAWPVVSLISAHTEGAPSLTQVGALLRAGVAQSAVLWREGWQPRLRVAEPGEVALLQALLQGGNLLDAVEAAPQLDFSRWLPLAVHSGLLVSVGTVPPDSEPGAGS